MSNETQFDLEETLTVQPADIRVINGIGYISLDQECEDNNPFVENQYDFEKGFYKGEFDFESPLTGELLNDTPETYGRHRLTVALKHLVSITGGGRILDLGCGTLDVARIIPGATRRKINMINADISGPWSSGEDISALERGAQKMDCAGDFEGILNMQYNFNATEWPLNRHALQAIVTNMALHHVRPELKVPLMTAMYDSLVPGGTVMLTDVFTKGLEGARFTEAGLRGPDECGGHVTDIRNFLETAVSAGFHVDTNAQALLDEGRGFQAKDELTAALRDVHATLAINKAIWYLELKK